MTFGVLVRARWRMAVNAARAAPAWHKGVLALLSLFTLGLCAVIAAACAGLVLLTQGGGRRGPDSRDPVPHRACLRVRLFLSAGRLRAVRRRHAVSGRRPLTPSRHPRPPPRPGRRQAARRRPRQRRPVRRAGRPGPGRGRRALHLSPAGWLWLGVAVLLLLLLTPAATALLLLLATRALGVRRVRAVVTAVSVRSAWS